MNTQFCRLLIVDDEKFIINTIRRSLHNKPFLTWGAEDGVQALEVLRENPDMDVVLTDIRMPRMDGLALLGEVKKFNPDIEVVILTAFPTLDLAVRAVREGAFDFLAKPFDQEKLEVILQNACAKKRLVEKSRSLQQEITAKYSYANIIGASEPMRRLFKMIETLSAVESNVLITGESGTGKELVAKALHFNSPRAHRQMLTINCSSLAETLLDSELFGHVKGAFTGAVANKRGLFEAADRGTLFLDEIGDISPATQVKILRAIEQGEIKPVGGNETIRVDVRIIAATNRDLEGMIARSEFREDLYYRLNVLRLHLPPLRERREDIPLLAVHFANKICERMNRPPLKISEGAMQRLQRARWRGNVRELENVIERAVIMTRGDVVTEEVLPDNLLGEAEETSAAAPFASISEALPYKEAKAKALDIFHEFYLRRLLEKARGNMSLAAQIAGMDRSNFWKLVKAAGIDPDQFK